MSQDLNDKKIEISIVKARIIFFMTRFKKQILKKHKLRYGFKISFSYAQRGRKGVEEKSLLYFQCCGNIDKRSLF